MVCPKCYGLGCSCHDPRVPCPECQGSGIVSCCDTAGAGGDVDAQHGETAQERAALNEWAFAQQQALMDRELSRPFTVQEYKDGINESYKRFSVADYLAEHPELKDEYERVLDEDFDES